MAAGAASGAGAGALRQFGFLVVGLMIVTLVAAVRIADPYPVRALRLFYFDYLQRLSPRAPADLPVRIVDIDETSLAALGQWPWPRDRLAELVRRLADDYGASAIAFDVLFPEPDRLSVSRLLADPSVAPLLARPPTPETLAGLDNDARFARAMEGRRVVLGVAESATGWPGAPYGKAGFVEIGSDPGRGLVALTSTTGVVPVLEAAAAGIGGINVAPSDASDVVRTVPMVWRTPDGPLPNLSLEALRVALGESTVRVVGAPDTEGAVAEIDLGDYRIPTASDGQLWIHYRHEDRGLYVSAADILAPGLRADLRNRLAGTIVLVGSSAAGLLDIRATPLGETVPGVSIHAQILEQILTGDFLVRGDFQAGLEIIAFVCLSGLVVSVMSMTGPVVSMLAGAVATALTLTTSWIFFTRGMLFDATFPALGGLAVFFLLAGYQFVIADREKRLIRKSFLHYVAPSVLREIEKSGHRTELGGQIRPVTVMFCDLRNFTPLSETMSPQALVALLNALFGTLSDCILGESGTIDKFIGDSIMAFWNAPLEMPDYRRRACRAALAMRQALRDFNRRRQEGGAAPLAVAVGLCSGPACVGNIGSTQRFSYSVIGDTVNVAARIEASCRHVDYDLVISDETCEGAGGMATLPAGVIALKGKSGRLPLHLLVGDETLAATPAFADLAAAHAALLAGLAGGGGAGAEALERCRTAAAAVDPGLAAFYGRLPARAADFPAALSAGPASMAAAGTGE
ncbi:MAG: adenylate/guanylate cyclase domain-containing protein [Proteobacteria bacterium]|nr:adenylate/guanylate cyclase domain-containing protein [Pseudomonadota bacterium]MBS0571953.1 adenylate/guanylate cyclase domain-containing protein [Pseudomonadota bacterium]